MAVVSSLRVHTGWKPASEKARNQFREQVEAAILEVPRELLINEKIGEFGKIIYNTAVSTDNTTRQSRLKEGLEKPSELKEKEATFKEKTITKKSVSSESSSISTIKNSLAKSSEPSVTNLELLNSTDDKPSSCKDIMLNTHKP